jgi:hypothetical protein
VVGVAGAVGLTLLVAEHPFDHHPSWHLSVFSALWAGLLVVCLALALLEVRTPALPLARAASVGLLGLGLAGVCGAVCPDPHFLHWWSDTALGEGLEHAGGTALSVFCFGLCATLFVAACAAFIVLGKLRQRPIRPLLPALLLLLLLAPGVALQSVGTPWPVFASWLLGTAAGAYAGVAGGAKLRALLGPSSPSAA